MKRSQNNPFMRIIGCMLLLLLSQLLTAFAIVFIHGGSLFAEGMTIIEADAAMLEIMYAHQTEILLISYLFIALVLWLMARRNGQSFAVFTGIAPRAGTAVSVLAFVGGIAAAFWMTIAVNMIPWPEAWAEVYQTESGALQSTQPIIDFIAVVLLAPFVEELLFRGVIYQSFCVFLPASFAVFFQGILFGSVHSTIIWIIYATFMGCILGYVRKHSGSTRPGILMHMAFNFSSYPFAWFASNYGEDQAAIIFVFIGSAFLLLLSMYGISFRTSDQANLNE